MHKEEPLQLQTDVQLFCLHAPGLNYATLPLCFALLHNDAKKKGKKKNK